MLPPNLHQPVARVQMYEISLIVGASERNGAGSKLRLGLPTRDDAMRMACRVKVISQRADSSKKVYIGAECFEIFRRRGTFLMTLRETLCKAEQFLSSKHLAITARFNFAGLKGVQSAAVGFSDVDWPGARSLWRVESLGVHSQQLAANPLRQSIRYPAACGGVVHFLDILLIGKPG